MRTHRRPVFVLLAAALTAGCPRSDRVHPEEPAPSPAPAAEPAGEPPRGTDAPRGFAQTLHSPAPMSHDRLAGEVERVTEQTDTDAIPEEPAVGSPGRRVVPDEPPHRSIDWHRVDHLVLGAEPDEGAEGELVSAHPRLFRRRPSAELDEEGRLTVRFETTRRVPGASVYYGSLVPEDPFGVARLRKHERGHRTTGDGRQHSLSFDAAELLRGKYDIADVRRRGRGLVTWRVEALDPQEGSSRVFDGRTPFRCEPVPCTPQSRFVQLPALQLGPFVDRMEPRSAVVSWRTDAATAGAVLLTDGSGEPRVVRGDEPGVEHEIAVEGLEPSTRYRYYAIAVDARGEASVSRGATFRTARSDEEPFTFLALSDSRSGQGSADARYAGTNRRILRQLLLEGVRRDPAFVMFVGDLVDGYTTSPGSFRFELEAWKRSVRPVAQYVPIYEVMGNHEAVIEMWEPGWAIGRTGDDSPEAMLASAVVNPDNGPPAEDGAPPYEETVYSFDWGTTHHAAINSNYWFRSHYHREDHPAHGKGYREGWVTDAQLDWLDHDLAEARERGAEHLFVYTHEPAFPNGGHVKDGMWWRGEHEDVLEQRARLVRILSEHEVAILFHGDEHNYSRTRIDGELVEGVDAPIWQVISGGAGAPYYAQNRDVPWADHVAAFDARQHFVSVRVRGDGLEVEAVDVTGETIDRFEIP